MRWFFIGVFATVLATAPIEASAEAPPIVTEDPGVYAQVFTDSVALSGMAPIRDAYNTMLDGELPANTEAALIVYERAIVHKPAIISRIVDDVVLPDVYRQIYLYHYFGDNAWLFTRLDFVRLGDTQWALSAVTFADRWSSVVLTTTPGFTATAHGRR